VIAIMGIGSDGHTAGIMPFPKNHTLFQKLFEDEDRWVVSYDAEDKNPYPLRITVTIPFLKKNVQQVIAFVVGQEKSTALRYVIATDESVAKTPARVMREIPATVQLFTDIVL
jgi:6-phosphogluconolactonase/glucosamine-6-phosphate isomerase/deaminase